MIQQEKRSLRGSLYVKKEKKEKKRSSIKFYTSVTGEKVACPSRTPVIRIRKTELEWLLCPITHDYPKIPVLFDGYLYDEEAIKKWFWKSLIHPILGTKVSEVQIIRVPIWRYLLLCLRNTKKEYVLFHQRFGTYKLAMILGSLSFPDCERQLYPDYDQKQKWRCHVPKNYKSISINLLQPLVSKKLLIKNDLHRLTFGELRSCSLTHAPYPNVYSESGKILHWTTESKFFKNGESLIKKLDSGVEYETFLHTATHERWFVLRFLSEKKWIIPSQIISWMNSVEITQNLGLIKKTFQFTFPNYLDIPFCTLDTKKSIQSVPLRSPVEVIRQKLDEMRQYVKSQSIWVRLSETWDGKFHGCGTGSNSPLQITRESLGLPFLVSKDDNIYGEDFSFMILKGKYFQNIGFKDYQFAASDLRSTTWINVEFSHCIFVDANLLMADFHHCTFNECIGLEKKGVFFFDCTFRK